MKKTALVLFISILLCANAYADSITLKSGRKIEGKIVERSAEWVKVDTNGVKLTYFLDEVNDINGERISVTIKEVAPAPTVKTVQTELTGQLPPQPGPVVVSTAQASSQDLPQVNMGLALAFFALFLVFGYIYPALCLQFIAAKTDKHPVWLAWVPVGNLFLMCKIAGINYLWLLPLLLLFVPYAGVAANLIVGGFIWFKIAQARRKPGWIGILGVVPILGLVIFAYLAFSE